jgi:hypothetical protein
MQVRKTGMGKLSTRQVCSREAASLLAQAIVKVVGRRRSGRVMLVGCEHIELLIQLAQHGFVDVTCLAVLTGPNVGEMSADIIIAPGVDREPRLAAVLSRLGRDLRPDGVLILGIAGSLIMTRMRQIQELLIQQRLAFVRTHLEPADVDLLCCRRIPALQALAA